jgi:hypothetical protein
MTIDEREAEIRDTWNRRSAAVKAILEVQRPQRNHLYWPQLEVDLTVDSIKHAERYPLPCRADQVTKGEGPALFADGSVSSQFASRVPSSAQ